MTPLALGSLIELSLSPRRAAAASLALILAPTILMGGTLPALTRAACRTIAQLQGSLAWLYFVNSAGAAAGALGAGFILIPSIGLDLSVMAAAAVNLLIGIAALAMAGRSAGRRKEPAPDGAEAQPLNRLQLAVVLVGIFLSGVAALTYEVAWIRLLSLVLGSSTYSFSLMLAAFIGGIAIGSFVIARRLHPPMSLYLLFGLAELGAGLAFLVSLPFYGRLPYLFWLLSESLRRSPEQFYLFEGLKFMFCLALMLPPTVFLGMTLPLASRLEARSGSRIGWAVGSVYSVNTIGNVLGAALAGLALMPLLGLKGAILCGIAVNLLIGLCVLWTYKPMPPRVRTAAAGAAAAAVALISLFGPKWDAAVLARGVYRAFTFQGSGYAAFREQLYSQIGDMLYYKDGANATVAVFRAKDNFLYMTVNGKSDASTGYDMSTQVLSAQIPLFLKPDARSALVVGLGSGITVGSVLRHPVEKVDVVEIVPAVAEAAKLFAGASYNALEDPRTRLHIQDAKVFLNGGDRRYDVVISEPSNPWVAGIASLFSTDFYGRVQAHLNPGGVFAQWTHLYEMNDQTLRLILRTFASSFKHVTAWHIAGADILLIGSREPITLDFARMQKLLGEPAVAEDLARVKVKRLSTLLSLQLSGDQAIRRMAGRGRLNEDLFPILEYEAPKAFFENRFATIFDQNDERLDRETGRHLALARYIQARAKPLSPEEFAELADFHREYATGYGNRLLHATLRAWMETHPADPYPRFLMAKAHRDAGRRDQAWEELQPLLARYPASRQYLELGAELELARFLDGRSYLWEAKAAFPVLERLRALPGVDSAQVLRRAAHAFDSANDYRSAVAYLGRAAAWAEKNKSAATPGGLWMEGAVMALKRNDFGLAKDCALLALKTEPGSPSIQSFLKQLPDAALR